MQVGVSIAQYAAQSVVDDAAAHASGINSLLKRSIQGFDVEKVILLLVYSDERLVSIFFFFDLSLVQSKR